MSRKKQELPTASKLFGDIMNKVTDQQQIDSGEIYRVQPVDLDTFVNSPEYLNQGMLGGMSDNQRDFLNAGTDFDNDITFFVLWVGKGGGKNWASSILFLYLVYKLLCMYDPHKFLNHNPIKAITLLNVAINAAQARDNFFDPMVNIIKAAGPKAFRQFGFNPAEHIFTNSVEFPKNIVIMSGNSAAGSMEGYDILLGLLDEIDDSEFHGATKLMDTMRTSANSRFSGKEKIITISYSRYEGSSGLISQFYDNAQGRDYMYARRYASWEFHPARTYKDFEKDFQEDPEKAACMYGSVIQGSFIDSWIKDVRRIKNAMRTDRKWILGFPTPYEADKPGTPNWENKTAHTEWRKNPMGEHIFSKEQNPDYPHLFKDSDTYQIDPYNLPIAKLGNPNYRYVFVGDPALGSAQNGGDGYGVCLAHREMKMVNGKEVPYPVIDFAFRFTGRMFHEGQVQMSALEDLFRRLKEEKGYNIGIFSTDGYNSASFSQWVARTYDDVIVHHNAIVGAAEYSALRDSIFGQAPPSDGIGRAEENGGIDIPWHPIVFTELKELREDRCFTGDTKIRMANGMVKRIDALVDEKSFDVVSWNGEKFVTGRGHSARVTYHAEVLTTVEFSNGAKVRSSTDHRYLLENGQWKEAANLVPGDRLRYFEEELEIVSVKTNWAPLTPLYDITVDEHANFLLADSMNIVHNSKNPPKVDHPSSSTGSKDITDTIARAARLILYQYPFTDFYTAGTDAGTYAHESFDSDAATSEERQRYVEDVNSNLLGMGQFRERERNTIESILDI